MYRDHFGLQERPFSIAPDPYYLFMSEQHREALAHLLYGIEQSGGFILLSGEVGTGKTTICRCLLEQMPKDTEFAFIMNTKVTAAELLETICHEFSIPVEGGGASAKNFVDKIYTFLLDIHSRGRKAVLIIDEAQNLDMDVLEQVRLLTNLETTSSKLLQIILLGQPELKRKLEQPELRQLAQRITARYHLVPLTEIEVTLYITHRLKIAGATRQIFSDRAIASIYHLSQGVPRLINLICDRSLLGAYSLNVPLVETDIVNKAAIEVIGGEENASPSRKKPWLLAAMTIVAIIFLGGAVLLTSVSNKNSHNVSSNSPEKKIGEKDHVLVPKGERPQAPEQTTPSPFPTPQEADQPERETQPAVVSGEEPPAMAELLSPAPPPQTKPTTTIAATLPFNLMPWKNETAAYEALFSLWGLNYNTASDGQPCRYAEKNGLRCYAGNGSFDEIKRINIPVYLRLESTGAEEKRVLSVALSSIEGDAAILRSGEESLTIPLRELILNWSGQYVLVWRPPPGYRDSIRPGHSGEIVSWIDSMLTKAAGRPQDTTKKWTYDDELVQRVKEFQFSKGLTSDGIAGSLSIIHLGIAANESIPRLIKDK